MITKWFNSWCVPFSYQVWDLQNGCGSFYDFYTDSKSVIQIYTETKPNPNTDLVEVSVSATPTSRIEAGKKAAGLATAAIQSGSTTTTGPKAACCYTKQSYWNKT